MYIWNVEKIGNIVTKSRQIPYNELFNVVSSYDDIIKGLPTLIIGWAQAKTLIPNADILHKHYGDVWWTFSKTERRCDYEDDIIEFYKHAIISRMNTIKYVYLDLVNFRLNSWKKIIQFAKSNKKKIVFFTRNKNFMFVYSEEYNTIFGISLTLCEYIGIGKNRVIKLIKNGDVIHDTSFIDGDMRKVIGNNTHYILPLYAVFQK